MRTKRELSAAVLSGSLRIVSATETASADDTALVEAAYDAKLAEWRRRGVVWWTNTTALTAEIPDEVYSILIDLIENDVAASYGKGGTGAEKRMAEAELLRDLRRLNAKPPSGEATQFSSY